MSISSLPTFPTLNKTHHRIPPQPNLPTTSSKFGKNYLIPISDDVDDAIAIAASTTAISLANAAVEAARDAVSAAELQFREWSINGLDTRRKRRRKRRKILGNIIELENNQKNYFSDKRLLVGYGINGFLSSRKEAELCSCLKEGARITETEEPNRITLRLAFGNSSVDKVLCNERESREILARDFRGLVTSLAASYQGKGLSLQDLVQEGTIGLLKGAEKFDAERGYKLSTYVYWWIKQAIIKAVARNSRLIRLPEIMAGPVEMIPEKMFEHEHVKQEVLKLLNGLTKREAEIVKLYFGLSGETPWSFDEIGRRLNLSRERVRQINAIALSKLKRTSIVDSLKFYVV